MNKTQRDAHRREATGIYISTCKDGRIFDTVVAVADSKDAARKKAEKFFGSSQVVTREMAEDEFENMRPLLERQKNGI